MAADKMRTEEDGENRRVTYYCWLDVSTVGRESNGVEDVIRLSCQV